MNTVKRRPRYRDAAIVMLICAILAAIIALSIAPNAVANLHDSWETAALSGLLLVGSVIMLSLAARMYRLAKRN